MSVDGQQRPPRPRIELSGLAAEDREAAAAMAAIERFLAETAPPAEVADEVNPWRRAALLEGVSAKRLAFPADPGSGLPLR